ncbi:ABC transporter substrate-binding protein [Microvirga sp. W0021]|uniref:ABC transporter substrate-binding protein n=1 Tax=Hohaiivirga grylli TaxID=3133970 RepID=A0ABV0BGS6_9HYPH
MGLRIFRVLAVLLAGLGFWNVAMAMPRSNLIVGVAVEPPGLDPTIAAPTVIRDVVHLNIFEGLVRINEQGKTEPLLAKSWTVSPDGLTYTFTLQENVQFHDGTPFNSSMVKYAFERASSPDSTNAQKQIFAPITKIDTPSPTEVVIHLKEPSGNFIYYLGWGDAVMVAPNTAADNRSHPVGTGPFKFKSWSRGSQVEMVQNESYWQKGKPKLESLTFRFIADPQAQVSAINAGTVDAFPNITTPELFDQWRKDKRFTTAIGYTEGEVVAGMNNARKPFDDVRVRKALMHAVDRNALIEGAYNGYSIPIGSHFSPNHPAYENLADRIPYDPVKARALLKEAGYPDGFSFTLKTPQMAYASRPAELLVAFFADIGVKARIEITEYPAKWISDVFQKKDYDMTIIAHAEPLDIGIYAREGYYFNYNNPAFRELMHKIDQTTDEKERFSFYRQAQEMLADDVPALFLYQWPKLGVWNAKLKGLWKTAPIPVNDMSEAYWSE